MIILIIFFINYILTKYKNKSRDYKIYNFTFNIFFISLYIFCFIFIFIFIRYKRWGFTLNFLKLYHELYSFITKIEVLHIVLVLQIIYLFFIILLQLKNLFIREVFKRHLHLYFKLLYKNLFEHQKLKKDYLSDISNDIEGIVFHHKFDDRMCKLRKSDFGIKRNK